VGDGRIVLDPDAHISSKAKKGADIGEVLAFGPIADLCDLGIVRDAALVVAFVTKNCDFWNCKEELLGRDGGTGAEEAVKDAMYVVGMLPNKVADLAVSRDGLVPTILKFIMSCWSFDASIVQKGHCRVGDLSLKNEDNIAVEYRNSASPPLWHNG